MVGLDTCSIFVLTKHIDMNNIDYSKISDRDLINIVDPNINKGGIPLAAVVEAQKRGLRKKTRRKTIHS